MNENENYNTVSRPEHYCNGSIECIDAMLMMFGTEEVEHFCLLNAFKYLWRAPFKGHPKEDHEKAEWYLKKYMELLHEN